MKYEPIDGGWKKLKENLAAMTFKDKVNHLWTYYKGTLVILVIVIAACSLVTTAWKNKHTTTLLSGISINVILSEEGKAYVQDDYFATVSQGGLEKVQYTEMLQDDFTNTATMEESYMGLMSLIALSVSEELDYILMDEQVIRNMLAQDIFLDLREFFTEEELEALGDYVIWGQLGPEDNPQYMPFAVNVEHIPFIAANADNVKDTYFAVVVNTPRIEELRGFWEYLHQWQPAA